MGEVIEFARFKQRSKSTKDAERLKALFNGNVEVYVCEECGGDIEVINNVFPTRCPCCGLRISDWCGGEK